MSARPWRVEPREISGLRTWGWAGTFASRARAQIEVADWRRRYGKRYEYRIINRDTAEVIHCD